MQFPAYLPLAGDRYTPFVRELPIYGYDFTGGAFAMQVRLTPDTAGSPLIDLATVTDVSAEGVRLAYGGTDTVANHIAAGRITEDEIPTGLTTADNLTMSLLGIRIHEATMEAVGTTVFVGLEPGTDADLAWDIHITPLSGDKEKFAYGAFTIRAGVTQ